MKKIKKPEEVSVQREGAAEPPMHRVRLPGFLVEEEIGLGDVIKRATYAMGIKPCLRCNRRAAAINRWMTFTR